MIRVLLAFALALIATGAAAVADCRVRRGDRVALYSTTGDPSVLMWDSRARLRAYYAAAFDEGQAMLPHAMLASPGTRAEVAACVPSYVASPLFEVPDDAVSVVVTSGPGRGSVRWVLGSDIRRLHGGHR